MILGVKDLIEGGIVICISIKIIVI